MGREFMRSKDSDRTVIWAKGMRMDGPSQYRAELTSGTITRGYSSRRVGGPCGSIRSSWDER